MPLQSQLHLLYAEWCGDPPFVVLRAPLQYAGLEVFVEWTTLDREGMEEMFSKKLYLNRFAEFTLNVPNDTQQLTVTVTLVCQQKVFTGSFTNHSLCITVSQSTPINIDTDSLLVCTGSPGGLSLAQITRPEDSVQCSDEFLYCTSENIVSRAPIASTELCVDGSTALIKCREDGLSETVTINLNSFACPEANGGALQSGDMIVLHDPSRLGEIVSPATVLTKEHEFLIVKPSPTIAVSTTNEALLHCDDGLMVFDSNGELKHKRIVDSEELIDCEPTVDVGGRAVIPNRFMVADVNNRVESRVVPSTNTQLEAGMLCVVCRDDELILAPYATIPPLLPTNILVANDTQQMAVPDSTLVPITYSNIVYESVPGLWQSSQYYVAPEAGTYQVNTVLSITVQSEEESNLIFSQGLNPTFFDIDSNKTTIDFDVILFKDDGIETIQLIDLRSNNGIEFGEGIIHKIFPFVDDVYFETYVFTISGCVELEAGDRLIIKGENTNNGLAATFTYVSFANTPCRTITIKRIA